MPLLEERIACLGEAGQIFYDVGTTTHLGRARLIEISVSNVASPHASKKPKVRLLDW